MPSSPISAPSSTIAPIPMSAPSGLELVKRADPESTGVESIPLLDPDGNPVLIDQHVPKPASK